MRRPVAIALVLAACCSAWAGEAAAQVRVGARVGVSANLLSRPADPVGEPTLLYGSAFSGPGFAAGLSAAMGVGALGAARLSVEADVLFTARSGVGFAEDSQAGETQTVELNAQYIQVPVRVGVELDAGPVVLRAALGPQLLFGVFSGSTVTYEGIDAPPEALETAAPNHIGIGALLGFAYQADGYSIPLELRLDWDPMVPSSTAGRFDEVSDSAQTYSAAFDFSGALMVGIDVPLAD